MLYGLKFCVGNLKQGDRANSSTTDDNFSVLIMVHFSFLAHRFFFNHSFLQRVFFQAASTPDFMTKSRSDSVMCGASFSLIYLAFSSVVTAHVE